MTISYTIDKFQADDGDTIRLIWNSDGTWSIAKYQSTEYKYYPTLLQTVDLSVKDLDIDVSVDKTLTIMYEWGMFSWLTTVNIEILNGYITLQQYTKVYTQEEDTLTGRVHMTTADFVKLHNIARTIKKAKPVHYCNMKTGDIVFDKNSFTKGT